MGLRSLRYGGVGIDYNIHAGMCLVADGAEEAEKLLVTVLTTDPGTAIVRCADAEYEKAQKIAKEKVIKMPMKNVNVEHFQNACHNQHKYTCNSANLSGYLDNPSTHPPSQPHQRYVL